MMVGLHKKNVSPQNHSQDIFGMTTMFKNSFILLNLFFHWILTFFVIVYDLDDLNMSLNVLEQFSETLSHYAILLKKNQQE
jgi:hypothetical protein